MGSRMDAPALKFLPELPITAPMEREKMEAWADALLEQHRTAPKPGPAPARRPSEHDRMAALLADAGVAPAPGPAAHRPALAAADPDAWVGKAQAMGAVLALVLLLGLVLALSAG